MTDYDLVKIGLIIFTWGATFIFGFSQGYSWRSKL